MGKFSLVLLGLLIFQMTSIEARSEDLKTINLSMPTNYGTFLGEVHYAEKDRVQALRVERIIKEDLIKVINYFEYVPHDVVHFNLDPYFRVTNGNARTFPTNIINLYNFPASNREHLITMENWIQGLVLHEFVHITHLDQTRDYLQVGRNIFGTIAKVPTGIVPRWFTEGIAVWGESHLITGGRLNNSLFNKELLLQFKDSKFCKTIDCLDDPGVYPHGQLAYWAGAQFMEFLENQKAKTIKCLVEYNSQAIPFFLNNAFESCTGEKAQVQFAKFREEFIKKANTPPATQKFWGEDLTNAFGADDFQKGMVLEGDRLFKVESHKFSEALVSYDLKDQVSFSGYYPWPISTLGGVVHSDNENHFLLVAFNDDPKFRIQNRSWKLVNPDTLLIEKTLSFPHDPSYVIALTGENFLSFSYIENHWTAEENNTLLKTFSTDTNIVYVKKMGEKLLLKTNNSFGQTSLLISDLKFKSLKIIYQSTALFDIPLSSEKYFVIRENDNLTIYEIADNGMIQKSSLNKELFNQVTLLESGVDHSIVLENHLKNLSMKSSDFEDQINKSKSQTSNVTLVDYKEVAGSTHSFATDHEENYPRLDHLLPHYWFLATGTGDNLNSFGATTTFVDPMEIYNLNSTALIYPAESKIGGTLDYLQKVTKVSDLWLIGAFINQDYSKTSFSSVVDKSRELTVNTAYNFLFKRWIYQPSITLSSTSTDDFISHRTSTSYGTSHSLTYQAMSTDDLYQYLIFSQSLKGNKANLGNSFLETQSKIEGGIKPIEDLSISIRANYSKLYKTDFTRGVLYAGGVADFSRPRAIEFFGLPYSNAYGDKITATRLMFDYNLWSLYRGVNLIPFFLRETHLVAGYETLSADRIFINNTLFRDDGITSFFFGPKFKLDIFYFVPVNLNLIFSNIAAPNGKTSSQADLMITADLF